MHAMKKYKIAKGKACRIPKKMNWNLCILCQVDEKGKKESLSCPYNLKRRDYNSSEVYQLLAERLIQFQELDALEDSLDLSLLDDDRKMADQKGETSMQTCSPVKRRKRDSLDTDESSETREVQRCFFWGETGDDFREASTKGIDKNVRQAALDCKDFDLLGKLSAGDMRSLDAVYHLACLASLYNRAISAITAPSKEEKATGQQLHGIALAGLISDIEEFRIQAEDSNIAPVFKLTDLVEMYTERLKNLEVDVSVRVHSTRLKERILGNIPDLVSSKHEKGHIILAFRDDMSLALEKSP